MNDERIKNQLRAWMAEEAGRITLPPGLREAAVSARTERARGGWRPGWSMSLPHPLLAGVSGLLVVVAGASLVLSGVLPIGRADCSRVSVDSVRAAAEAVPGYAYRMSGSEMIALPEFEEGVMSFQYVTATTEFIGAYRAPDAWSLEISFDQGESYRPPSTGGFLISHEWEAYIVVGGIAWGRPRGTEAFARMPEEDISVSALLPNRLTDLLAGEPFRWSPRDGDPLSAPLTWAVETDGDACRLVSTNGFYADHPEVTWQLDLLVDPETSLPDSAIYHLARPEVVLSEDEELTNADDIQMRFTFDYASVPEITPPTNLQILPVTEEQARDDAVGAGSGLVMDLVHSALGATDVFAARGVDGTALLVYEEGFLESARLIDEADDVVVEAVAGTGGRFLLVVMNDFRVERVEVDYSVARTDEFRTESNRLALVPFPERKGEAVTWRAYDENGNELVLNPRPPDI